MAKKSAKTKKSPVKKSPVRKSAKAKKAPPKKPPATGLLADVQNLLRIMVANDVTEIDVEDGKRKIVLKRGSFVAPAAMAGQAFVPAVAAPAVAPAEAAPPGEELIEITSPMVGTFYAASGPDSDDYARTGAILNEDTVVCIVEAMKVMNEIKAECSGTIVEICVKNAEPVEYGQVLFRVRP